MLAERNQQQQGDREWGALIARLIDRGDPWGVRARSPLPGWPDNPLTALPTVPPCELLSTTVRRRLIAVAQRGLAGTLRFFVSSGESLGSIIRTAFGQISNRATPVAIIGSPSRLTGIPSGDCPSNQVVRKRLT